MGPVNEIWYRRVDDTNWHEGQLLRLASSELLFYSEDVLELGAEVAIRATIKVEENGSEIPVQLNCDGQVVGRYLANWPESIQPAVAVRISECKFR
jgi:hypothetical protein